MLTENDINAAFRKTNKTESLCEGWTGLLRFGREVERITALDMERDLYLRIDELENAIEAMRTAGGKAEFQAAFDAAKKMVHNA